MEWIINAIDKTMQQSLLQDFKFYLQANNFKEFIIYSDYCLDDREKPNDVATFTIAPACSIFPNVVDRIEEIIPKDTKDQPRISEEAVNLLRSKLFFHINFWITDIRGVTAHKNITDQEVALESIDGRLAGYIAYMLTSEAEAETVAWFSDRDKIIEAYDNYIANDLFEITHTGLCEAKNVEGLATKLGIGIQETDSNELWYDPLIRIPDYLAGALSSWNLSEDRVVFNKHMNKQIILR